MNSKIDLEGSRRLAIFDFVFDLAIGWSKDGRQDRSKRGPGGGLGQSWEGLGLLLGALGFSLEGLGGLFGPS